MEETVQGLNPSSGEMRQESIHWLPCGLRLWEHAISDVSNSNILSREKQRGLGLGFSGRAQSTGRPNLQEALALGVGAGLEIPPLEGS